jgi:hypothetical protein
MQRIATWMMSSLVLVIITVSCVLTPDAATSPFSEEQVVQSQLREPRSGNVPDRPRGIIQITNDWRDEVRLSLWSHRREPVGEWTIGAGDNVVLEADGERIKVRPSYKIKVGEDWGWVNLGEVGQFQQGTWFVNVRSIWSATHRERRGVPDWKR